MSSKKKANKLVVIAIIIALLIIGFFVASPLLKIRLSNWAKEKVITYVANNSDYELTIDSLSFKGLISIELHNVILENKLTKEAFNIRNKYQTDWIKFEADNIRLNDISWKNWISDKGIRLSNIEILKPHIYVYRDKRKPREPFNFKPLPTRYLRTADQSLTVPQITLIEGNLKYEEAVEKGKGNVYFSNIFCKIRNLSTDKNYIINHPKLLIQANAQFLDTAKVEIKYEAEINNPKDKFTLEGTIQSFPAPVLNQLIEPLAKFRVETGVIDDLKFKITADDDRANGSMHMKYHDLKTQVMSNDIPRKESKIKTFIANALLRDNNSTNDGEDDYKEGEIAFERKKNYSVFHYWVNSIKTGVISIITEVDVAGLKKTKEKIQDKLK